MEGTRGPGKTDAQLMFFRKHVGVGYGRFWRGVIFDREYKNLDDLVSKSQRWFPEFADGARFHSAKADYKWVWPTGEELLFRRIKKKTDYFDYHGQEFPFIGWNELTKFPTNELYEDMKSCNRSSYIPPPGSKLPEIPLTIFSTTNPYGSGHNWVKTEWIDPAPPGVVQRRTINVFDPRLGYRRDLIKSKVRIFCSYKENKYLSAEYIADLESITDENKRRAWLHGDWDIVAGGALDDLWGPNCLVPRFRIPKGWRIDRSMDWGSTHPFSVGWWAEATGEEITLPGGRRWAPVAGSLFRIYELYGAEKYGTNKGIKMSPTDLAKEIKRLEHKLKMDYWIQDPVFAGPADNQIRNVNSVETETIEYLMLKQGVSWTASDKSQGSRKIGLELVRQRLANTKTGEGPGLYFMSNCKAALTTLPVLPRDDDNPDDVDTDAEDHVFDEVKYRVLASNYRYASNLNVNMPR